MCFCGGIVRCVFVCVCGAIFGNMLGMLLWDAFGYIFGIGLHGLHLG